MDLIGTLLSAVRTASPLLGIDRLGEGTALAIPQVKGAPFHYVLEGSLQLIGSRSTVSVQAGDLFLIPHGTPHCLQVGEVDTQTNIFDHLRSHGLPIWTDTHGLDEPLFIELGAMPPAATLLSGVVAFEKVGANMLLPHLPEMMVFPNVRSEIRDLAHTATNFISNDGRKHDPGYAAVALRMLELLIIAALRRWLLDTPHESGWLRGLQDPLVSRTLLAMHREPGQRWKVGSLAQEAGCSRSLFASRFHAVVGETPLSYLTRLRIGLASAQLRETRRSTEQIAADAGYSSAYAFERAFKANTGLTPSRFRHQHAERPDDM